MATERPYEPPKAVGEPFRADPSDAAPFLTENDKVPAVPVESAPTASTAQAAGPPLGHPPTRSTTPASDQPVFRAPTPAAQLTPEARFARTALWAGVASIFIFNIILGPIAIVMGTIAYRRGEKKQGRLAIIFGVVGTVVGIVFLVLAALGMIPTVDEMIDDIRNGR